VLNAINTPEAQKALYEAEPRVPAMTSVVAEVKASNPDIEALQAAAKDGLILPAIPAMAAVWDPLGKSQAAIIGGADPASTMASAQAAIVKAIG
jgi:arabinogalactan oligomer/maltooligosaccharide transport system substrate-binding protein